MKTTSRIPSQTLAAVACCCLLSATAGPEPAAGARPRVIHPVPSKKLIEFGHSSPSLARYLDNIQLYESGPFDGITLRLSPGAGSGNVFMVADWKQTSPEARARELDLVERITAKTTLGRHFLALFGASQMDWFSDEDWALAEGQVRFASRLAKSGGFRGILWDAEPYKPGKNPWRYPEQPSKDLHSFEDYYARVKERGAQFMRAIQEEYPGVVILSLRELSDFQQGSPFSQTILPVTDADKAVEYLRGAWWGLHLPFTLGMVEAMNEEGVTFIDANEEAYYYTSPLEFYRARDVLYNQARAVIPEPLRGKFRARYDLGHAIAPEYIAGNWAGLLGGFPVGLTERARVLSPADQARWLEHSAYYALLTSDEYAWIYSERINWWTGENLPEGFVEALQRARRKVAASQPLGFEMEALLERARAEAAVRFAK